MAGSIAGGRSQFYLHRSLLPPAAQPVVRRALGTKWDRIDGMLSFVCSKASLMLVLYRELERHWPVHQRPDNWAH
jgi:hypothetical protein